MHIKRLFVSSNYEYVVVLMWEQTQLGFAKIIFKYVLFHKPLNFRCVKFLVSSTSYDVDGGLFEINVKSESLS